MIKAICFDLDGTLGRYTGDFQSFAALLRSELMLQMCDMNSFFQLLDSELRRDGPVTTESALLAVLDRLEQRPPPDLARVAAYATKAYAEDVKPLPGAAQLLQRLDDQGVKLALVSNGPHDMQMAALQALGFARHFRVVLISGDRDVAARKPAPRIFSLACAGLQTVPQVTLMVGDTLGADIVGAVDYGLKAVLVDEAGASSQEPLPEGVAVVSGMAELSDLLGARYGL